MSGCAPVGCLGAAQSVAGGKDRWERERVEAGHISAFQSRSHLCS